MILVLIARRLLKKGGGTGFSQFGEDLLLAEIFANCGSGVCVDVGANDGVSGSNSYYLERQGWKCVLVEPNPMLCRRIGEFRPKANLFECAASAEPGYLTLYVVSGGELAHGLSTVSLSDQNISRIQANRFQYHPFRVQSKTLDSILNQAGLEHVEVVSIDVEGHELSVLQGLTIDLWKPRVLIIEDNSEFADLSTARYLAAQGYVRVFRSGVNDWYAHRRDKQLGNLANRLAYQWQKYAYKLNRNWREFPTIPSVLRVLRRIRDGLRFVVRR